MHVKLRAGRVFDARDVAGAAPVVVINQALADLYSPGMEPVGRVIIRGDSALEIVGVIDDVRQFTLDRAPEPVLYLPEAQAPSWLTRYSYLVVRTAGDPMEVAPDLRSSIRMVDRAIPVSDVRPMSDVIGLTTAPQRFRALLLGVLGALALALASLGVYGVMSYAVAQRTREIGIRMALGARARDVANLLVRQEMRPVLAGVAIGIAGALATGRLLAGFLFGITTTDVATLFAAPLLLAITAFMATLLPASRAVRVDPVITLRND
jgi:putative ABC transport system permease protein